MTPWKLGLAAIAAAVADPSHPRCSAKARSAGGRPCKNLVAVAGTRCRFHGKGGGPPPGTQNALRTGEFTGDAIAARKAATAAARAARATVRKAVAKARRLRKRLVEPSN